MTAEETDAVASFASIRVFPQEVDAYDVSETVQHGECVGDYGYYLSNFYLDIDDNAFNSDGKKTWWHNGNQMDDDDEFVAGQSYTVRIIIDIEEGSSDVFTEGMNIRIGPIGDDEETSAAVPAENITVSNAGKRLTVEYTYIAVGQEITQIWLSDDDPEIGGTPSNYRAYVNGFACTPVSSVTVTDTSWNCDGVFQPSTDYTLTVQLTPVEGYMFTANTVITNDNAYIFNWQTGIATKTFTTPDRDAISGHVVDSEGNPIAGASVAINKIGGGNVILTTDADGSYYIDTTNVFLVVPTAPSDGYAITAQKAGYAYGSIPTITRSMWSGGTYNAPNIVLEMSTTKTITVTNESGNPVRDAVVTFSWGNGLSDNTQGTTNQNGTVTLNVGGQTGMLRITGDPTDQMAQYAVFNAEVGAGDIEHVLLSQNSNNVVTIEHRANNGALQSIYYYYERGSTVDDIFPVRATQSGPAPVFEWAGHTMDLVNSNSYSNGDGEVIPYPGNFTATVNRVLYTQWVINKATVTFLDGYDELDTGIERIVNYGDTLPSMQSLGITYTGHRFLGWKTAFDGQQVVYEDQGSINPLLISPDVELSVYAHWAPETYTVTLNTNGGTINAGNVTSYTYGTGATLPTDVTKDDYRFVGWYANANFGGDKITSIAADATGDKEYWAKWSTASILSFSVGINQFSIDGTAITFTYPTGTNVSSLVPTITVSDGCVVSPASGVAQDFTQPVTYSVSLSDDAQTYVDYRVIVKVREATPVCTVTIGQNNSVTLIGSLTGLKYSVNGGTQWTDVPNSGAVSGVTVANGLKVYKPASAENMADSEIQNFAFWNVACVPDQHLIADANTLVLAGDDATLTVATTNGYHLPDTVSVKKGNDDFANTYDKNAGTIKLNDIDGNLTVTVVPVANTYTVIFNKNNGAAQGTMEAQVFTYGVAQNLTANAFTLEGYGMTGWSIAAEGQVVYANGASVSNLATENGATVELFAQWAQYYLLTYDANGGSNAPSDGNKYSYLGTDNATVADAGNMSFIGQRFTEWNTQANGNGTAYSPGSQILMDSNKTLYAMWTPITYTVEFVGGEGATGTMAAQSMTYGTAADLSANTFQKTGYTFVRWSGSNQAQYTDRQNVVNLTDQQGGRIVLAAQWAPITYNFEFYKNDGTQEKIVRNATYDVAFTDFSNTYARDGYLFVKWNTQANGNGTDYFTNASATNLASAQDAAVAMYAVWSFIATPTENTSSGSVDFGTDTSSVSITIDATGIASARNSIENNAEIDKVVVRSSDWSVDIPSEALNHIAGNNQPITLSVAKMDNAEVPESVKAKTSDMQVISLNMMVNNVAYTDNFGGMLTITVPYILKDGETADNLYIWTFNEATGQLSERTKVTYADGNATFQVAHFSYWALGPYTEPAGSGEFPIMIVAIAVVTVIAVAGAAAYFFLAKKKA